MRHSLAERSRAANRRGSHTSPTLQRANTIVVSPPSALNQIWAATTINRTTRPLVTPATMNPIIAINHSSMGQT